MIFDKEFKATHRYTGGDWTVLFEKGTEVVYKEDYKYWPDDAIYEDANGTQQIIRKNCVEEI